MFATFFKTLILSIVLLVPALADGPAEPSLWRYVHPNSKALVGIQWSQVEQSDLGRWIQSRWIPDLGMPGIEFLKGVEQVLISSPGVQPESPDEDPRLLIAIQGNFDLARLRQVLVEQGAKPQTFAGIPIFRQRGKAITEPAFALLSSRTILIGDIQTLFSSIERLKVARSEDDLQPLVGRAQDLAARYDCWALMSDTGAMHNFLFTSLAGKTLSPESQGFQAGISVRNGLAIDVVMAVRNERAARVLQGNLNRLIRNAETDKGGSPEFASLIRKLRITADRSSVLLTLRMTALEASQSFASKPRSQVLAKTDAPKLVIRIEGLDEGSRELPFKP